MNSRYLFKAKKKNWQELLEDEQWVTGTIMYIENKCMMLIEDEKNLLTFHYLDDEMWSANIYAIEVDESTICECTGLTDKDDTLIWEMILLKFLARTVDLLLSGLIQKQNGKCITLRKNIQLILTITGHMKLRLSAINLTIKSH